MNLGEIFNNPVGLKGFEFRNGAGPGGHGEDPGANGACAPDITLSIADYQDFLGFNARNERLTLPKGVAGNLSAIFMLVAICAHGKFLPQVVMG